MDIARLAIALDTKDLKTAQREFDRLSRQANQSTDKLVRDARKAEGAFERLGRSVKGVGASFGSLGTIIPAALAGLSAREIIRTADAYTDLNSKLKLVTGSSAEAAKASEKLFGVSQGTRQSFEQTVSVFQRFAEGTRGLGIEQDRLFKVVETVNQAVALSGASAESANAALIQLGQGLASGTLRGEELNSVLEQTPALAQALADGLGVSRGQLRQLGQDGELTSKKIFEALEKVGDNVNEKFAQVEVTVGAAFTNLRNSALLAIGEIDKATGATESLSGAFVNLSQFIDENRSDLVELARTFAPFAVGGSVALGLAAVGSALVFVLSKTNPVILGLTAIGAAVNALRANSDEAELIGTRISSKLKEIKELQDELANERQGGFFGVDEESIRVTEGRLAQAERALAKLNKEYQEGKASAEQLAKAQAAAAEAAKSQAAAVAKLGTEQAKLTDEQKEAQKIAKQELADAERKTASIQNEIQSTRELAQEIGLTVDELEALELQRIENQIAALESSETLKLETESSKALRDEIAEQIKSLKELKEAKAEVFDKNRNARANDEAKRQQEEADRAAQAEQKRRERELESATNKAERESQQLISQIEQGLTDAIIDGFENGKGVVKSFGDFIKNYFKTFAIRVLVQPILGGIGGAAMGLFSGAANAAGGDLSGFSQLAGLVNSPDGLLGAAKNLADIFNGGFDKISFAVEDGVLYVGDMLANTFGEGAISDALLNNSALIGNAASIASGVVAGVSLGRSISNGFAVGGGTGNTAVNLGTAAGAALGSIIPGIGTALGAAIGGALGGAFNRAFGRKAPELRDSRIQGGFDADSFSGQITDFFFQKGGWFRSDRTFTQSRALSDELTNVINDVLKNTTDQVAKGARILQSDISGRIENFQGFADFSARSEDEFRAGVQRMSDDLIAGLLPSISAFRRAGETMTEAFDRITSSVAQASRVFILLGEEIPNQFAIIANSIELIEGLGTEGVKAVEAFFNATASAGEKSVAQRRIAELTLQELGLEEFSNLNANELKDYIKGLDLTTEAGREEFKRISEGLPALTTLIALREKEKGITEALGASAQALFDSINGVNNVGKTVVGVLDDAIEQLQGRLVQAQSAEDRLIIEQEITKLIEARFKAEKERLDQIKSSFDSLIQTVDGARQGVADARAQILGNALAPSADELREGIAQATREYDPVRFIEPNDLIEPTRAGIVDPDQPSVEVERIGNSRLARGAGGLFGDPTALLAAEEEFRRAEQEQILAQFKVRSTEAELAYRNALGQTPTQEQINAAQLAAQELKTAEEALAAARDKVRDAEARYFNEFRENLIEAEGNAERLSELKGDVVDYYNAQKEAAEASLQAVAGLRDVIDSLRLVGKTSEEVKTSLEQDFAKALFFSRSGINTRDQANLARELLPELVRSFQDTASSAFEFERARGIALSQAEEIARNAEADADLSFEEESIGFLDNIDEQLELLRDSATAGEMLLVDAIDKNRIEVSDQLTRVIGAIRGEPAQAFASGGVFTNSIVSQPTRFGSNLMGEAGPEAIMPLANVNGRLGIRSMGNGSMVAELQAVRAELAMMRSETRATALNTAKVARVFGRVDDNDAITVRVLSE